MRTDCGTHADNPVRRNHRKARCVYGISRGAPILLVDAGGEIIVIGDYVEKTKGRNFGIVWSQFNKEFGTTKHGLSSLPKEKFDDAKKWLKQYRASKIDNLQKYNPKKYVDSLSRTIYACSGSLGWTKQQLYSFISKKLDLPTIITSLDDLEDSQLKLAQDRVRYEAKKLKRKKLNDVIT